MSLGHLPKPASHDRKLDHDEGRHWRKQEQEVRRRERSGAHTRDNTPRRAAERERHVDERGRALELEAIEVGGDHYPEQDVEDDLGGGRARQQGEADAGNLERQWNPERRGAHQQTDEDDLREPHLRHAVDDRAQPE